MQSNFENKLNMSALIIDNWNAEETLEARRALEASGAYSDPQGITYRQPSRVRNGIRGILGKRSLGAILDIRFVAMELTHPKIPQAFDGYRILHLTDPHFDAHPGLPEAVFRQVSGVKADLFLLGGDYRAGHGSLKGHEAVVIDHLSDCSKAVGANDGTMAILGNHDHSDMVDLMLARNIDVVLNQHRAIAREGGAIHLVGTDDVNRYYTDNARAAVEAPHPPGDFSIAFIHSPDFVSQAAAARHDFYLTGHTHGGQVCIKGKPVYPETRKYMPYLRGKWVEGDMIGYTRCGAGVSAVPWRVGCPPEITLFTLRRGNVPALAPATLAYH